MTIIHEVNPVLKVNTPFGEAQVLFLMDYGIHQNTIWVVCLKHNGKILHYDSNQLTIDKNNTLEINTLSNDSNEEDCMSYFYDKWDDWDLIIAREQSHPGTVWSDFDSGEKVCGIYQIDVIGYFITTTPGEKDETYGHYNGHLCQQ